MQELLARRFPRPDVASTIRKLPQRRDTSTLAQATAPQDTAAPRVAPEPQDTAAPQTQPRRKTRPRGKCSSSAGNTVGLKETHAARALLLPALASDAPGETAPCSQSASPRPLLTGPARSVVEPLSLARYRIQLNASPQLKEKLELARDLLSHSNPSGDLGAVIERALDLLLERTLKKRFAQTKRPRRDLETEHGTTVEIEESRTIGLGGSGPRRMLRRHIPNSMKRQIAERDGLRCTFVSSDGQRCGATQFSQVHHHEPWARGGGESLANLRILCAAHNQFMAEQDFGKELVADRTQRSRGSAIASLAGRRKASG